MKVPFAWGTELQHLSHESVRWLIAAVESRHQGDMDVGGLTLPPASWGLRRHAEKEREREMLRDILRADRFFDGALLDAWLHGPGGRLFDALVATVAKSVEEQRRERLAEPAGYMAGCVCVLLLRAQKEQVKRVQIRGVKYETLERALGHALSALCDYAFRQAFAATDHGPLLRLIGSPWSFVSIRNSLVASDSNPYGLVPAVVEALAPQVTPDTLVRSLDDQIADLAAFIARDKALALTCARLALSASIRDAAIRYLTRFDRVREPARARLAESIFADLDVAGRCEARPEVAEALFESLSHIEGAQSVAPESLQELSVRLAPLRRRKGLLKKGGVTAAPETAQWAAASYLCLRLDEWAAYYVEQALARFDDKGAEFDTPQLKELYDDGRLYRYAPDKLPSLRGKKVRKPEGHLFADIKGFTRRTVLAKAVSTADFLKSEFYAPVLNAAAQIHEETLTLNNLLGDAVSFSGSMSSLLELADAIDSILRRYKKRLLERDTAVTTQQVVKQIHARRDQQVARIDQEIASLRRNLDDLSFEASGAVDLSDDVAKLHVRLYQLDEQRERTVADANREIQALTDVGGLEAGLYIAYGAPTEQIELDIDRFGHTRIAIAEGINESARGTARSRFVRELLDEAMQHAIGEGRAGAALPFDVYVLHNDRTGVSDIYNVGQALSREALAAFVQQSTEHRFYRIQKGLMEVPEDIRERFVFLSADTRMQFVLGIPTNDHNAPELFRSCGSLTFKGFEQAKPTEVYERIPPVTPFFEAMRKVFAAWASEAQQAAPLEDLP